MLDGPRIHLLAATGFTGRLIARELGGARGVSLLLTGRDPQKLGDLAARHPTAGAAVLDVTDEPALRRQFRPGDVVLNCAGPFTRLGEPVVRAAVAAGAHYLDTTGEQEFMRRIQERYDAPARAAGVTVVNAMAFEYALGCCAATLLSARLGGPLRSVDIVYGWRVGPGGASAGTRRSVLQVLGGRSLAYCDGAWVRERIAGRQRRVRLDAGPARTAVNFPAGEAVTLPSHLPVATVRGWIVVGRSSARLLGIIAPVLPAAVRLLQPLLDPLVALGPPGPDEAARRASRFTILAEAVTAGGESGRLILKGRDPYGLTAAIAARGALRLAGRADASGRPGARSGSPIPAGVVDPAVLMDPRSFLDGLEGVTSVG
jgi:short subunit dehydrogenase-like uncharacterized protein